MLLPGDLWNGYKSRHVQTWGKGHCLFKLLLDWTLLIINVSNSALWGVWNKVNQTQDKGTKNVFFCLLYLSHAWFFSARQKGHDHNMERFLCFFFGFGLNFLTTDTPPLTRWPFSMVSQASHTHGNTTNRQGQTHALNRTAPAFRQLKRNSSRLREERGVERGETIRQTLCHPSDATEGMTTCRIHCFPALKGPFESTSVNIIFDCNPVSGLKQVSPCCCVLMDHLVPGNKHNLSWSFFSIFFSDLVLETDSFHLCLTVVCEDTSFHT